MRVISLGAGVQSTTVLLLANHGELPGGPVDYAIFADTGWEPAAVYEHLAWLESMSEIPILRVATGNLRADALDASRRFATMPVFVFNEHGGEGRPRFRRTWVWRGQQASVMWGNGFGFRLRVHPVQAPSIVDQRASHRCELRFRSDEWERICAAADGEGSSTYNFVKRAALAAARRER